MKTILAKERSIEDKGLGNDYIDILVELAAKDEKVVSLEADLRKAVGTKFLEAYPKRTFDCGVQEANMVGIAAGLGAVGMKPYAHSFGSFITRRAYDQIFITCAYGKGNVKLIGSDPGITATYNGGTHMPFEDAGIMRLVPDSVVIDITDSVMLKDILTQIKDIYGVQYIRLPRCAVKKIYNEGSKFDVGKGVVLREGSDITIIVSGILVSEALDAAEKLEKEGISSKVVNMFTWKPIDEELIIKCARETGAIVTAENHNILNGLGSAVAEVLVENCPVPMGRIGSKDKFGEVGQVDYLIKVFEMTGNDIEKKIKAVLAKK